MKQKRVRDSGNGRLKGIGIDIVSQMRVQNFLKRHRKLASERLLTLNEKRRFRGNRLSVRAFSRLFAAKEAFFKAQNVSWMGIDGFSKIDVTFLPSKEFLAVSFGRAKNGKRLQSRGHFFETSSLTGAYITLQQEN